MRVMSTAQNGQHKNESEAAKEISIPGTLIRNMNYYNFSEELYWRLLCYAYTDGPQFSAVSLAEKHHKRPLRGPVRSTSTTGPLWFLLARYMRCLPTSNIINSKAENSRKFGRENYNKPNFET